MPLPYSRCAADLPHEVDPSTAEADFNERTEAFFSGEPVTTTAILDLSPGAGRDEPWMRELDDVVADSHTAAMFVMPVPDELDYEIIEDEPHVTAYDRRREELRRAEAERNACEPDTPEYAEAMGNLATAKRRLKTEIDRDGDDHWRELRRFDEWRAGEGREVRKASRRKVRSEPNKILKSMTADERAAHENMLNADRVYRSKKRKAGWTDDQIAAGLAKLHAKRAKKVQ